MLIKVLVVDDFEAFRESVCSMLLQTNRFQVVGQAVDGFEAIEKAEALQPDLILLDIHLPRLDGIAATQQIRKLAPKAKILFLTGIDSPEMAEEALTTGASGYLVKFYAGKELLEALEVVMQGGQFVSHSLRKDGKVRHNEAGA
jgi:two-component system, NarL family, invasion response regulator UvrY